MAKSKEIVFKSDEMYAPTPRQESTGVIVFFIMFIYQSFLIFLDQKNIGKISLIQ